MSKYLILKGCAGLGNRIITLCNAIDYSEKTGRVILVDWSDGQFSKKGLNPFYKFFSLMGVSHIEHLSEINNFGEKTHYPPIWGQKPESSLYDLYDQEQSKFLKRLIPGNMEGSLAKVHGYWRFKKNRPTRQTADVKAFNSLFQLNDIPFGGKYKKNLPEDVIFYSDFCPPFSTKILRENIKLNDSLDRKIQEFSSKNGLNNNTIGVHVRMTDKQPRATLKSLLEKIKSLNLKNPQIFLATDSSVAEIFFKDNFNNVIYRKKWRPESTGHQMGVHQYAIRMQDYVYAEKMLEESIMDMWLLSKCENLIYQENSSFSRIASYLKNEPDKTLNW